MRADGDYRAQMARASPPNVKIARLVALGLDHLPNILRHTPIWVHVEQGGPGVADQAMGPGCGRAGADDPGQAGPSASRPPARGADDH